MANNPPLPKKVKKKTTAKLKKELWTVFTKYIKARDKNICFTCDRKAIGQGMGGGHYKPKGACGADAYFSEINVNAQCTFCNLILQGNQVEYRERLIKKYGRFVVEKLEKDFRQINKFFPYSEKIEYYKSELIKISNE